MKEVIERCNWLVNKCEDKAITPDVKDDISYLLEEIKRLNKGLEYMKLYWSNREEYEKNELLNQIRDKDTSIEWLERAIEEEKKREILDKEVNYGSNYN